MVEPKSWKIGNRTVAPYDLDDEDERGILWVYEEPRDGESYVVSLDPTVGRAGWTREFRTEADLDTDNAALEVFRAGRGGRPDVQVAEYVAPVDAIDFAPVAATVGLLYGGSNEDGQALIIGEVTGPGAVTLRELIDHYNYSNLWQWTQWGSSQVKRTQNFWWYSSRSANKDLWMRGMHHIQSKGAILHSKWLVEEMADCVSDIWMLIGEARYGRHDDRVMSTLFNFWALHDWSTRETLEPIERPIETGAPKWEASDISYDEMVSQWNQRMDGLSDD